MKNVIYCSQCGKPIETESKSCPYCGSVIEPSKTSVVKEALGEKNGTSLLKQVRWSWVFISAIIVIILICINRLVLSYVYRVSFFSTESIPVEPLVWSQLLMIFLSGFITALISPGKTITEPAIGCVFMVAFYSILAANPDGFAFGWVFAYFFGFAGARVGEFISTKVRNRKPVVAQ